MLFTADHPFILFLREHSQNDGVALFQGRVVKPKCSKKGRHTANGSLCHSHKKKSQRHKHKLHF